MGSAHKSFALFYEAALASAHLYTLPESQPSKTSRLGASGGREKTLNYNSSSVALTGSAPMPADALGVLRARQRRTGSLVLSPLSSQASEFRMRVNMTYPPSWNWAKKCVSAAPPAAELLTKPNFRIFYQSVRSGFHTRKPVFQNLKSKTENLI